MGLVHREPWHRTTLVLTAWVCTITMLIWQVLLMGSQEWALYLVVVLYPLRPNLSRLVEWLPALHFPSREAFMVLHQALLLEAWLPTVPLSLLQMALQHLVSHQACPQVCPTIQPSTTDSSPIRWVNLTESAVTGMDMAPNLVVLYREDLDTSK